MTKLFYYITKNLDKLCHSLACILLVVIFSAVFLHTTSGISVIAASGCGFFAAVTIGILKEAFDFIRGTSFSIPDLIADIVGSILGFMLTLLLL